MTIIIIIIIIIICNAITENNLLEVSEIVGIFANSSIKMLPSCRYATLLDHDENGDTTVLEEFLDATVKGQCEGLMVKILDVNAAYQPDQRSLNWLKLKKDYLEGLGDSVNLVPLGAYHGKGKRTGVYGA